MVGGGGEGGGSDLVTEVAAASSCASPSWHCCRCRNLVVEVRAGRRHLPRLNLVARAPWGEDSEAARTMVRDWAMLGTCSVSQLPPITPSSFSELWETERLEEDWDGLENCSW